MTSRSFASLGPSAHAVVVRARQNAVAASNAYEALRDADPCQRERWLHHSRCTCGMAPALEAACKAELNANADLRGAEASWSAFSDIRRDDVRGAA